MIVTRRGKHKSASFNEILLIKNKFITCNVFVNVIFQGVNTCIYGYIYL